MVVAVDPFSLLERLFVHGGDPAHLKWVAKAMEEAAELRYARLAPPCGGASGSTWTGIALPRRQCVVARGPHCSYLVSVEQHRSHGSIVTAQPVAVHPHGLHFGNPGSIGYRVSPAPASLRSAFVFEGFIYVLSSDITRDVFRLRLPPTPAGAESWEPGEPPAALRPRQALC